MVGVRKRLSLLRTLLSIRLGAGAAVLPSHVTRLDMQFAKHIENGHRGPRKFWRLMYPRLKYHNPAIPMTVRRSDDKSFPAILSVFMRGPPTTAQQPAQPEYRPVGPNDEMVRWKPDAPRREPAADERVVEIGMQHRSEQEIWDEFVSVTGAVQIQPTPAEVDEMDRLAAQRKVSEADRERTRGVWEAVQRERNILKMAKGEMESDEKRPPEKRPS